MVIKSSGDQQLSTRISNLNSSLLSFNLLIFIFPTLYASPTAMPPSKESQAGYESNCLVNERPTRRRVIRCCENCRSSKSRCSKYPLPCERCLANKLECIYLPQDDEGWDAIKKAKEERQKIDEKVAKRARRDDDSEDKSEDESDIEPSPLIATDAAYEDDDEFEDNGVRIGRFILNKRIGSDYRPKMMEEVTQMLDKNDLCRTDYDRQVFNSLPKPHWLDAAAGSQVLDPDPAFIAPSLFSHTLQANQYIHNILRSQDLADKIMRHYFHSVHSVACILHRPSFQERYDIFWSNSSRGVKDTPESTQALVYAALFAGVVSMDAETVREELGGDREEWVKALEEATAISLSRAHVIRTEKPETMQAFVMYLIPMCRSIISRTLATLVASAIDLARGMGLNRDGTCYGYDAVVTQVHRMIWHQLCFLDIRVCESQSPRARIRKDDFDTQFPLNIDDSELEKLDLPKENSERWTGMTLSIARMECNEKIREIHAARQRIRQGEDSYSAYIKKMLVMIYEFRRYMEKKYYPMIDDGIPIQHYTRLVIDLQCRRMHAIVLHEYHMSTRRGSMPEQWSQTVIKSGLETMEIVKEIETSDFLQRWRWYAGALQQYHYATLMLIEVFAHPGTDHAMRAWELLGWIFEVPSSVPHTHKGRWVLEGAVGVMKEYLKARKLRCPTIMDEVIAPSSPVMPTSPKLRRIAARPTKTITTTQTRGKCTTRSGISQGNSRGTISDNHPGTLANANLPNRALPQTPVMSNMRASLKDIAMASGARGMHMDGVAYENTERASTGREPTVEDLLASAPYFQLDGVSSEEDPYVPTPPDISPDGSVAFSWQSTVDSDSAAGLSGCSSGDNLTRHSSYPGSQISGDGRGGVGETSCAGSADFAPDHRTYYPHSSWNGGLPVYIPTGNDNRYENASYGHWYSNLHDKVDEGSFRHFPGYPSSSHPGDWSGFTPGPL